MSETRPARTRTCEHCTARTRIWTRMTFRGHRVCSLRCAAALRDAERKTFLDERDSNPTVCRCDGAPAPLEAHGVHCRSCRRMFSADVRLWLATESRAVAPGPMGRLRLAFEDIVRRGSGRVHDTGRSTGFAS